MPAFSPGGLVGLVGFHQICDILWQLHVIIILVILRNVFVVARLYYMIKHLNNYFFILDQKHFLQQKKNGKLPFSATNGIDQVNTSIKFGSKYGCGV
jgi:hypothetical protein